jgi:hypothetical protein
LPGVGRVADEQRTDLIWQSIQFEGGPFAIWVSGSTTISAKFKGKAHYSYGFAAVGYDNAGNASPPGLAHAITAV